MSDTKLCPKGHYYDKKLDECPFCPKADYADQRSGLEKTKIDPGLSDGNDIKKTLPGVPEKPAGKS